MVGRALMLRTKPSFIEVHDEAGTCALTSGQAAKEISLGSTTRKTAYEGGTLLWEKEPGKPEIIREETDQLPPVLLYGNRY